MRDNISADMETVLNFSNSVVEVLGLYSKTKNLLLLVLYRQPDDVMGGHRSTHLEFKQAVTRIREVLSSTASPTPDILLCGDFNLPHVTWLDGQPLTGASRDEQKMIDDLIGLANEHFLTQFVHQPTHRQGNILDLICSNNPRIVHNLNIVDSVLSDHGIIECQTTYGPTVQNENSLGRLVTKGKFDELNFFSEDTDWVGLESELRQTEWRAEFRSLDLHQMLGRFLEICIEVSEKYVPKRKVNCSSKTKSQIPRERKNLMRKRRRIKIQLQKITSEARRRKLKMDAKEVEIQLLKSYQKSQMDCETKAVNSIKKNPKYFFSYAKKFSSVKVGIGPFVDAANELVIGSLRMAEMLAEQYQSVFSTPKESLPEANKIFQGDQVTSHCLHNVAFDKEDIVEAIDQIPSTAAAGPDRFPPLLLKMCKYSIAEPLFLIWRKSLDTGKIPSLLKIADIVPIFKNGNCGIPSNYRPVALTSHLIKVFEKVLRKYIVAYMEENRLFNSGQHGFRLGRSCLSQLIAHFDHITRLLESGQNVDVVYLDFAKAFDKVDFLVTMRKLHSIGISGKMGKWIYSFLTDRKQAVIVNGTKSSLSDVRSGVPQGSVLGPLLFLVLIGDIDKGIRSSFVSSFADDTRVSKGIRSVGDVEALQSDLQSIYKWADENNMEFNFHKFESLRYGNNDGIKESTSYRSKCNEGIKTVDHAEDLGITMSSSGNFRQHISTMIDAAQQLSGWVLRTFTTRKRDLMLLLWKSLIRSKLEYCSPLWCPTQTGDIQSLEQVQRNFLRKVSGMQHLSYWQQLQELSLYSLERRRERYIIIYIWQIIEGKVPNIDSPDHAGIRATWSPRRGRNCIVPGVSPQAPRQFQNIRYSSFAILGPRLFNSLPSSIRNKSGCTVDTFKFYLDKYLATVPDEPLVRGYTAMRRAESNSLLFMARLAAFQQV